MKLSTLKKVSLREVWKHEARDFSRWLSQPENLALLSDEIGIEISLIQTEAAVGKFQVDIYAEEAHTSRKIIIENQLEQTDHDHLGKIITYASGLEASIIIWLVKHVRDEHQQAIDWLNEHTHADINFFAIQIEIWKIADSPYAPRFHTIAKPNDWTKIARESKAQHDLTDTKKQQMAFWTDFKEYAQQHSTLSLRKVYPQHWYNISIGSSRAYVSLTVNSKTQQMACELYITDDKALFDHLLEHRAAIEQTLGTSLQWEALPQRTASRIILATKGNLTTPEKWESDYAWLLKQALAFQQTMKEYLR